MRITKYVLGLDGANRFDSFYSVGAPARDFVPYSAVDNRDNHVTDKEFDVELFRRRWHREPTPAERGCMLSHVNMWRDFLATDTDWALIAEDDILISPDAEAVVNAIITKYPQVQLVNLCDAYSFKAGTMNPRVEYIRLSLLSPFVCGKYRMGKLYGSTRLGCTGLYLISRSGAELLLKQLEGKAPGTVADDYTLYQQWGVDVRFVQPGLCDWEGSSVILDSGRSHLEMLAENQKGSNTLDRLRIALAPKMRLVNAKNALDATLDEVKQRLGKAK
ncbi:MAG: glycosyltransferase family 25 protein [Rothia sp.]|uniref:glycosyltransferase family 25 protein n=1 Tax=Rothia sp. (in: high G+C Gram-positive bacteria) TaxID=1885016 RepID=UPI001CB53E9F|nr:glycosyltransferase family 25 protein [Rothia sp. (in: high G+C Gram-positive bacteria)]MBF1676460.1 glycosyltransferase family 25 protein [Rothia sp. (in: high G+C Gram-positive bacteria)]